MGGWCSHRDDCQNYTSAGFAQPVERLCFDEFEYPPQIGVEAMGNINSNTHADGVRIAEWIALVGNQTSTAIAARFGFAHNYAMLCLRSALIDGHLAKVRVVRKYWWTLPCDAEKLRADSDELSRIENNGLRKRIHSAKSEFDDEPGDEPFTHSVVPAMGAAPIKFGGANSIFNLVAA